MSDYRMWSTLPVYVNSFRLNAHCCRRYTLSVRLYSSRKRQDKIVIKENKMLVVYCTLRPYFSPPWCRNMVNLRTVHDRDVFRFHSVLSKEFEVRYNTCNFGFNFNSHQHRSPQIIRSTRPQRRLIRWLG